MEVIHKLIYTVDMFDREEEIKWKGYYSDVTVVLPNSSKYKVSFYDPGRLRQEVESENYIAEPGLIIIKEVTKTNMEKAVYESWLDGFFESLIPID